MCGLRPNCAARCGERRRGRSSRTGLPVTCTRSGYAKNDSIPGHGAYTSRAHQLSSRLVFPGTAFCSITAIGTWHSAAASDGATAAYPPRLTTASGRSRRISRVASTSPPASRMIQRGSAAGEAASFRLGSERKSNPCDSTSRRSSALDVPTKYSRLLSG